MLIKKYKQFHPKAVKMCVYDFVGELVRKYSKSNISFTLNKDYKVEHKVHDLWIYILNLLKK